MSRKINIARLGVQLFLWLILTFFLLYYVYDGNAPFFQQFVTTLIVTGLNAIPAYYSTKVLVPRLLYKKRIQRFIWAIILTALASSVFTYFLAGIIYYELSGKSLFTNIMIIQYILSFFFVFNCIAITVSSAIQIIADRFGIEEHLHVVEDEKVNTELAFLRAQINPHFLFNVLNTIYFQINKENNDARNSVEKLSEMLRYQLYECTTDMIDISKELSYIKNYVAVQQLRMESGTDLQLKMPSDIGSFKIAPLLLLPLVENAFKHISNFKDTSRNKLYITINIDNEGQFVVKVENTFNQIGETDHFKKSSGLGLKNLERRLALLYPGKHSLTRLRNENMYETTLKIRYHD